MHSGGRKANGSAARGRSAKGSYNSNSDRRLPRENSKSQASCILDEEIHIVSNDFMALQDRKGKRKERPWSN